MTDLERAREILAGYPLETAQHVIAEALAAARREGAARGAAEMRHRAAELAEVHWGAGGPFIADDIRDLPLTPEKPA